ncbi:MAG TPA: hypothetical protein VFZ21_28075 [Gemmatimonadaceae bacterium]|nr:hypothetical protein [Gemmatimonadaceae bacterium]
MQHQTKSRRPGTRRRKVVLVGLGAMAVLTAATTVNLLRDPLPHMLERRSALASAVEGETVIDEGHIYTPVRVTGTSGLAVDLMVRRAVADTIGKKPLAVILGGHYTGRRAAELLGDTPGVHIATLSYPYTGDLRPNAITFLRDIPKIRQAFLDTPPAVMLAMDYLTKRTDIDSTRVEAIGVSLGVPFISIAGALDARFARVWALHGSGGSYAPLEANMKRTIGFAPLRALAAAIATVIINGPRLDPVNWVPQIAPRPFIMVNASGDERLPRPAVDALYSSARDPKELVWMDGKHIHSDRETIQKLVGIVMSRVR